MDRVNRYTGEVLPWKTVSNITPDKGINEVPGEDLCRLEDFESIGAVCARFLNSSYDNSKEFAYVNPSETELDNDSVSDLYDDNPDDLINTQIDLEDYLEAHQAFAVGDHSKRNANNSENSAETISKSEAQGGSSEADDDGAQQ